MEVGCAAGRNVHGHPAEEHTEIRSADQVAVLLEDGLEQLVHDRAARVLGTVA